MVFRRLERRLFATFDWQLVIVTYALAGVSLLVLYSAGFNRDLGNSPSMTQQLYSVGAGTVVMFLCMMFNTAFWRRWAYVFYGLGCVLLIGVLVDGVVAGGARRWLAVGPVRVQPSEFMKLFLILALAQLLTREDAPREGYNLPRLILPAILVLVPFELIRRQPDLGTALAILLMAGSMIWMVGIRRSTLLKLILGGGLLMIPAWEMLHDYQRQRILTFMSPELDPLGTGYHAIQSKIAVGSGMIIGKGFMQGTQTQLRFLPEQTTDFIFSVLAEEWGFVGSVVLLALYSFMLYRLIRIALRCGDPFASIVTVGVAGLIFWQLVVNIGMVSGILPVVGITLPLLSFGGSSLVTVMACVGVVVGFSIRRFVFG